MKDEHVTDTEYLDALPLTWNVEAIRCPELTPGSKWARRYIREVTILEMQMGFEYLRIGDTHRFHETELWCTITDRSYQEEKQAGYYAYGELYRTPSGRTVWRRHNPS